MEYFRPGDHVLGRSNTTADLQTIADLISGLPIEELSFQPSSNNLAVALRSIELYFSAYLDLNVHHRRSSGLLFWVPSSLWNKSAQECTSLKSNQAAIIFFDANGTTDGFRVVHVAPSKSPSVNLFSDLTNPRSETFAPASLSNRAGIEVEIRPKFADGSNVPPNWEDVKPLTWSLGGIEIRIYIKKDDACTNPTDSKKNLFPHTIDVQSILDGHHTSERLSAHLLAQESGRGFLKGPVQYRLTRYDRSITGGGVSKSFGSWGVRPGGKNSHSARAAFLIKNALALPDVGLLMSESGKIIQDIFCQFDSVRIENARNSDRLPIHLRHLDGTWLVIGTVNNVVSHFIFESLKRVLYAANYQRFSVLVPPKTANHICEFLHLLTDLGIIKDYLVAEPKTAYSADSHLYVCEDNRDFTNQDQVNFAFVGDLLNLTSSERKSPGLFVSRSDSTNSRALVNESEIESLFTKKGYISVTLAEYTLREKLSFFANSDSIAGPAGAGLLYRLFFGPKKHWDMFISDSFLYSDFFIPQLVIQDSLDIHSSEALPSFNPAGHYFPRNHASSVFPIDLVEKTIGR